MPRHICRRCGDVAPSPPRLMRAKISDRLQNAPARDPFRTAIGIEDAEYRRRRQPRRQWQCMRGVMTVRWGGIPARRSRCSRARHSAPDRSADRRRRGSEARGSEADGPAGAWATAASCGPSSGVAPRNRSPPIAVRPIAMRRIAMRRIAIRPVPIAPARRATAGRRKPPAR